MTSNFHHTRRTFAVAALIAAGLALSGCGRKAGLDLPPGAGLEPDAQTAQSPSGSAESGEGDLFDHRDSRSDLPPARAGKKAFVLDPLLD